MCATLMSMVRTHFGTSHFGSVTWSRSFIDPVHHRQGVIQDLQHDLAMDVEVGGTVPESDSSSTMSLVDGGSVAGSAGHAVEVRSKTFNANNKIVKERIWITVKLTIQNRGAESRSPYIRS